MRRGWIISQHFTPTSSPNRGRRCKNGFSGLRSSDDLFSGAVVPNGMDAFKGQQWSTVFSRVKSRFTYFKDDGANRLITTHLDNLLGEIESRPTITIPPPSPQPPPPKELPEIEKLRQNALQDAATIAQLKMRINELENYKSI